MEKEDNEALAILRARHERVILGLAETVKYSQWQEAIKAREGLDKSLANAVQRYTYYERQLGKKENEITIPELEALDTDGLLKLKFQATEPEVKLRDINVDIARDLNESGGKIVSSHEVEDLTRLELARVFQIRSGELERGGLALSLVPQFDANAQPLGVGVSTGFGGVQLSKIASILASVARSAADGHSYEAAKAAIALCDPVEPLRPGESCARD